MTTFKASGGAGPRALTRAPGGSVPIARMAEMAVDGALPFRLTAFDGSTAGPAEAPLTISVDSPRALQYLLTAPGDLGMARAYISGDLVLGGVHPADPYPMLAMMADEL